MPPPYRPDPPRAQRRPGLTRAVSLAAGPTRLTRAAVWVVSPRAVTGVGDFASVMAAGQEGSADPCRGPGEAGEPGAEGREGRPVPNREDKAMSTLLIQPETQTATASPAAPPSGGPLRRAWQQIRAAVQEMNYGARRAVEVQAPWVSARR